ncbi:hypothetical protein HO133_002363 [Letharia lupina]|uniref:Uncharacterized protein n=1 Tax=Letharia lupina TaxID=560253 RepID=A0A8H6CDK0_9LECA|nr:uncharacterized protein HO133_002363 [Letharia lupina]KAF6221507.1 hypothetical protein HO133_002363 [Letharia lupina]
MLSFCLHRRSLSILIFPFIIVTALIITQTGLHHSIPGPLGRTKQPIPTVKPTPLHKPISTATPTPVIDAFPLAASAKSPADLPPIPSWNNPPTPHVNESTPLFIGFTRNWPLLQQTVVSYITAGWPPEDIYVIENTGVMHSNRNNLLTLQNPFYLDHHRLTKILSVNVISTPTLFTFAQLQNFYTFTALENNWSHYWWAHMDTVVLSDEEWDGESYKSLYMRAVDALRETLDPAWGPLATRWFAYDKLALVRTQAFVEIGGWDTMIPFYMTDCDMHERLWMREFRIEGAEAGRVWDVHTSLDDLERLYKRGADSPKATAKREGATEILPREPEGQRNSAVYQELVHSLNLLQDLKSNAEGGRNTWQARQRGGHGEPFYRDPEGFEKGIWMWMDFGRDVYTEKWGRGPCNLREAGLVEEDAWRLVKDWENADVQKQFRLDREKEAKEQVIKEKAKEKEGAKEKTSV